MVHLVAKTHLDLGFTHLAGEVAQRYADDFFPRAIATAEALAERPGPADGTAEGGRPRLVWTTGSWILREALERRGSTARQRAVAAAVERGHLAWHGLPLTFHTELADADLLRHGLSISRRLDERFGRRTLAAKMTDVPGHTRSLVPLLAEAGIRFLHLGVNPAWPVPAVPPAFRWRSPDGAEVVVAYSAGGYGGDVVVEGCDAALAFLHAGDNLGPPSAEEVVTAHAEAAARHPGAEVRASTLDAFAADLLASGALDALPVVTAEIGDPWLFGAGSDPQKVSRYRRLLAARTRFRDRLDPAVLDAVQDRLLLVAEHTWGLDQKVVLPTEVAWDDAELARLRATPAGRRFEASWAEQRAYVDEAADLLAAAVPTAGDAALRDDETGLGVDDLDGDGTVAVADGVDLGVDDLDGDGAVPAADGLTADVGPWTVRFDPGTGAIVGLVHRGGRVLADADHPLGLLSHQTFSAADYHRFYAGLTPTPEDRWWAVRDNTKPGIDAAGATAGHLVARATGTRWRARPDGGVEVVVRVGFPSGRPGAPPLARLHWTITARAGERSGPVEGGGAGANGIEADGLRVSLRVGWPAKPATRLPEATWLTWNPVVADPSAWTIDKLGQAVSPLDVVRRGGRALHAAGPGGLRCTGADGDVRIETPDAPLVAPGRPNLLDADPPVPDLAGGWHVLLHDNCWGTNFPMWNEGPAAFTVTLTASP